jgi:hypothetical protein
MMQTLTPERAMMMVVVAMMMLATMLIHTVTLMVLIELYTIL